MRVCLVMANFAAGGAERVGITLASQLLARGHDVQLVVIRAAGPLLPTALDALGSERVHRLGSKRLVSGVAGLASHIRLNQPDVLLAGPDDVAGVSHLARRAVRRAVRPALVAVVHTTLSVRNSRLTGKARLAGRLSRRLLRYADRVVAVSGGACADLVAAGTLPPHQVEAIPNPIDVDTLRRRAKDAAPALPEGRPLLVMAARLAAPKDHATLLRAFALVRGELPGAQLLVVGDGPRRGELEVLSASLDLSTSVHFLGHLENPWVYMRAADLFAFSSMWEGWSLAVAEALGCGTRVVATDCRSGPREILDDGRYGWLVPVGDAPAMANTILRALASEVPFGGPESVEARYGASQVTARYEEVLAAAAGSQPRARAQQRGCTRRVPRLSMARLRRLSGRGSARQPSGEERPVSRQTSRTRTGAP
jgi:glycosyltransferase involved in cell wall biosynthesis